MLHKEDLPLLPTHSGFWRKLKKSTNNYKCTCILKLAFEFPFPHDFLLGLSGRKSNRLLEKEEKWYPLHQEEVMLYLKFTTL